MPYLRQPSVSRDRIGVEMEAAPLGRLLVSRIVAGNDHARALTRVGSGRQRRPSEIAKDRSHVTTQRDPLPTECSGRL